MMIIQFIINYYVVCLSERDREDANLKRPGPSKAVELKKKIGLYYSIICRKYGINLILCPLSFVSYNYCFMVVVT